MIDLSKPIEAVNVEGIVCPVRIVATDVLNKWGRQTYLGLMLECGQEVPFVMDPSKDHGWAVASGRMLDIRNVEDL